MKRRSANTLEQGLEHYRLLLRRYHAALNLLSEGALASLEEKLDDALAYARAAEAALGQPAARLLDLGSGAGLPAVVVALALPEARVVMVERRQKRSAFLRLCVGQLGLSNAEVHQIDVRELELAPFSVITAQAVSTFESLYRLTRHLHARDVVLLSRKGADWPAEVAALEAKLGAKAAAEVVADLHHHGRLVQVRVAGGLACPS